MLAVTWQGHHDVRTEDVPDPTLEQPTDAVIRITSSGLCGSDLHLYDTLTPFMTSGDVLGHEPLGIVEEVGAQVSGLRPGDRVVVPFQIACGHCPMCSRGLQTQCETTQVTEYGTGAALFGYSRLYGAVPGAQAEYLRVPHADYGPVKLPEDGEDDRFLFLSDVLPTAWQAVAYADVAEGGTLLVLGAGPIGLMCTRVAVHRGLRVLTVDLVEDRLRLAADAGAETIDLRAVDGADGVVQAVRESTEGRGADSVVDAVGMEAHGSPIAALAQRMAQYLPAAVAEPMMLRAGMDRMAALHTAIAACRRGGTVSLVGVYGGAADPMPMMQMFDKQLTLRMGQANVRRWIEDLLPLVTDEADPLGATTLATQHLPLDAAAKAYRDFRDKAPGVVKVVFRPA